MVKPSRRRGGPLLPPLPLPLHSIRFILSHPHPVRLRMGERGRQIRLSAPMGNISELERGHSPVTPRGTCQTLTSSSKVESASMSDKCEIRFQGASGGPGQVAQASNFEATHRASSSPPPPPPLDLLKFPDEFKSLGTDRLLPCYLNNTGLCAYQQYDAYLHWFYYFRRGPAPLASLADAASMCLEKEKSMMFLWRTVNAFSIIRGSLVGKCIVEWMRTAIKEKDEIERPFGIDAAECIAKEAELISEWLRHGRRMLNDDEYTLCHKIRTVAAKFFIFRGEWSADIAAALLGIRKEAEWLIENLKSNYVESNSTSMKIRQFALDFLCEKYDEYESYKNEERRKSEMASESDDDVAESKDNYYVGDLCDEDYLKLFS